MVDVEVNSTTVCLSGSFLKEAEAEAKVDVDAQGVQGGAGAMTFERRL